MVTVVMCILPQLKNLMYNKRGRERRIGREGQKDSGRSDQ
jgi:hypothetical protein